MVVLDRFYPLFSLGYQAVLSCICLFRCLSEEVILDMPDPCLSERLSRIWLIHRLSGGLILDMPYDLAIR